MFKGQCYIPQIISIKIINKGKKWVIQKNTGVEEKWAQKKEELERKIRKNNLING